MCFLWGWSWGTCRLINIQHVRQVSDLEFVPLNSWYYSAIWALWYLNGLHFHPFKYCADLPVWCLPMWNIAGYCSNNCIKQTMRMLKEKWQCWNESLSAYVTQALQNCAKIRLLQEAFYLRGVITILCAPLGINQILWYIRPKWNKYGDIKPQYSKFTVKPPAVATDCARLTYEFIQLWFIYHKNQLKAYDLTRKGLFA